MIYVVCGHPRSGTSMMMQALEAGGLSVVRSDSRDAFNLAHSDARYRPNPNGLYEPDLADLRTPGIEREWDGKAIKVVVGWLPMLPVHEYRVVFMRRNSEEIRQSFAAAFTGGQAVRTAVEIDQAVESGLKTLRNRRDVLQLVELEYEAVIKAPEGELEKLDWFIDVRSAATVVNASLYRFRREHLVEGA